MNNFIYENDNSLSMELCEEIIQKFESDDTKKLGTVISGYYPNIKDSIDLNISNDTKWEYIYCHLFTELMHNVKMYTKKMNDIYKNCNIYQKTSESFKIIEDCIDVPSMFIKKYEANKGKYVYHNDFCIDYLNGKYRKISFLWYLNNVEVGGETDFFAGQVKIQPKMGKLILFPACWTFPHSGKVPYSDNKYILTGWIYTN